MSLDHKLISVLNTPENVGIAWDAGVQAEHFEEAFAEAIYDFITKYWLKSQRTAVPTAEQIANERPYIVYDEVEEECWWLVEQILERAKRNDLQEMIIDALNEIDAKVNPDEVLTKLRVKSYHAAERTAPRCSRSDMTNVEERRQRYNDMVKGRENGLPLGISFGLPQLDKHTGGLLPGELCMLGAYSGVGKTFFLSHMATHVRRLGFRPIIFTLEMSKEDIENKIDCFISGVSYDRLTKAELSDRELWWLDLCRDWVKENMPLMIEQPRQGERTVQHLLSRARHVGADIVLIDQLSHMDAPRSRYESRKEKYTDILTELDNEIDNAALGKLPCVLAAQFKRESLDHTTLLLTDFADAAECERFCDFGIGLARNTTYRTNRQCRMDVMKARRGDEAAWDLTWNLVEKTLIAEYGRIPR